MEASDGVLHITGANTSPDEEEMEDYTFCDGCNEVPFCGIKYKIKSLDEMIRLTDRSPGNALDKLNQIISFNARFAAQNENLCILLTFLSTELTTDVDFEPTLKVVHREYANLICRLIREGIEQCLLKREIDPQLTAITFIALYDGVLHQWVVNRDSIDGEKYVRTFRKLLMSGIQNEGPKPKQE